MDIKLTIDVRKKVTVHVQWPYSYCVYLQITKIFFFTDVNRNEKYFCLRDFNPKNARQVFFSQNVSAVEQRFQLLPRDVSDYKEQKQNGEQESTLIKIRLEKFSS